MTPRGDRVSIRRVAQAAGVAIGTVSKALNGDPEISEATRERVRRVARELGYRPMALARGLASGKTGNVAVAVRSYFRPVFLSAFYAEVLAGVELALEKRDLNLLLTSLKNDDDLLRLATERRADGILYLGFDLDLTFLRELSRTAPIVVIDGEAPGLSSVVSSNRAGMAAATRHLLARGRRRLAFMTMSIDMPNFRTRYKGFCDALQGAGLDAQAAPRVAAWTFTEVLAVVRELLAGYRPDAIVCANDTLGYMTLQALEALKVAVPEGVAIVGYDGTSGAEHRRRRLSTMWLDKQRLGAEGVRLLLKHVAQPGRPPQQVVVEATLEQGDTS
jgi:LacI family repressor for deo operon, udp, cdd, tsx, nupC, and nupG